MKVITKKDPMAKRWYRRLRMSSWLTIVGGVIIFGSWVSQNHYKAKWDDKIQMLQRSQLVVDIGEMQRSFWERAYYEELRRKPVDTLALAKAALELTRAYLDLYTWSFARISEDPVAGSQMMEAKHMIDSTSRQHLREGNYEPIFKAFRFVNDQFEKNYMKLDFNFGQKVDEVRRIQEIWQEIFIGLYVIGSILLGWAFLNDKLSRGHG